LLALALVLAPCFTSNVYAQAYSGKPVRMVVPFPPGGGIDTVARIISPKLSEYLGQSIVIDKWRKVVQATGAKVD
jgi:tripartite-type tricarboxylate transporter receptor subunit TctC